MSRYHWSCEQHDDCFALDRFGRCRALQDTTFKGECPFYKTEKQYEQERQSKMREEDYEY